MKKHYTNDELITLLRGSEKHREEALVWIYSISDWGKIVKSLVRKLNGTKEDAYDAYSEGFANLIEYAKEEKLKNVKSLKPFFINMCKYYWLNKFNRGIKGRDILDNLEKDEELLTVEEMNILILDRNALLDKVLDLLGPKCKEILKLWAKGMTHEDIAIRVNYSNADVSKKEKSLCLTKAKNLGLDPDDFNV